MELVLFSFQTPYYWPSKNWAPENTDYAVYLCKRTMQNKARLELADYEAENLARLQVILFIHSSFHVLVLLMLLPSEQ